MYFSLILVILLSAFVIIISSFFVVILVFQHVFIEYLYFILSLFQLLKTILNICMLGIKIHVQAKT